jgi:hypothetical protein
MCRLGADPESAGGSGGCSGLVSLRDERVKRFSRTITEAAGVSTGRPPVRN